MNVIRSISLPKSAQHRVTSHELRDCKSAIETQNMYLTKVQKKITLLVPSLFCSLQNLAMFLSMLVAWMIPDVPRSLREQLKKENMMLMEFLLNQDQEARIKSHSSKDSNPCYPSKIDIVVEAPLEEKEEQQVEEEEERVKIDLDEPRRSSDSDPEIGRSFEEGEENQQYDREGEGEDKGEKVEQGEEEKDGEVNDEDKKVVNEKEEEEKEEGGQREEEGQREEGEQREEGGQREEGQREEEEKEKKADENFTVDLDSFMSEMGLLGEWRKLHVCFLFLPFDLHVSLHDDHLSSFL